MSTRPMADSTIASVQYHLCRLCWTSRAGRDSLAGGTSLGECPRRRGFLNCHPTNRATNCHEREALTVPPTAVVAPTHPPNWSEKSAIPDASAQSPVAEGPL